MRFEEGSAMRRRTLVRGAAWTAPIAVVGTVAPAYAASTCVGGQATLTSGTRPTQLTFGPSTVTATVAFSSTGVDGNDQTPGETGLVQATSYSPSWNFLKLHHPQGMTQGDTVTLTLTFSQQVTNLSLTITDIDKDPQEWQDEVLAAPAGFTSVKAANVVGTGTAANPFRSNVNGGISSAAGDVVLTWAGPLNQVTVTYRVADKDNGSGIGQHVGVGKIGFTC